ETAGAGRLLESLHCTLSTLVIAVPPLRERLADLPILVRRCLERGEPGDAPKAVQLTAAAEDVFHAYAWPGNLTELAAVLEGARTRARGERIDIGDLPLTLRLAAGLERTAPAPAHRPLQLDVLLEVVER